MPGSSNGVNTFPTGGFGFKNSGSGVDYSVVQKNSSENVKISFQYPNDLPKVEKSSLLERFKIILGVVDPQKLHNNTVLADNATSLCATLKDFATSVVDKHFSVRVGESNDVVVYTSRPVNLVDGSSASNVQPNQTTVVVDENNQLLAQGKSQSASCYISNVDDVLDIDKTLEKMVRKGLIDENGILTPKYYIAEDYVKEKESNYKFKYFEKISSLEKVDLNNPCQGCLKLEECSKKK